MSADKEATATFAETTVSSTAREQKSTLKGQKSFVEKQRYKNPKDLLL